MLGSLGVNGLCQLLVFYLGWCGHKGKGRVLDLGKIKYLGEIDPNFKTLSYRLDIRRICDTSAAQVAIADGAILEQGIEKTLVHEISVAVLS